MVNDEDLYREGVMLIGGSQAIRQAYGDTAELGEVSTTFKAWPDCMLPAGRLPYEASACSGGSAAIPSHIRRYQSLTCSDVLLQFACSLASFHTFTWLSAAASNSVAQRLPAP